MTTSPVPISSPDPAPAFALDYAGSARSVVYAGAGLLRHAGRLITALTPPPRRTILCSDDHVLAAQGADLIALLESAGLRVETISIPAGEDQKHMGRVVESYARFAAIGIERGDVVIALGGGVPGDLFGFVAASYLRGAQDWQGHSPGQAY